MSQPIYNFYSFYPNSPQPVTRQQEEEIKRIVQASSKSNAIREDGPRKS